MRRLGITALLISVALTAEPSHGKGPKWALWGSSGSSQARGSSWWVRVQDGATSFAVSAGNLFVGRGAGASTSRPASRGQAGAGRSASKQPWFSGVQPRSRAQGGSSQSVEDFIDKEKPGF